MLRVPFGSPVGRVDCGDGSRAQRALLTLIGYYQTHVSPRLPIRCIYDQTCSNYSRAAIRKYGAVRGAWLTLRRVSSCGPWSVRSRLDSIPTSAQISPQKMAALHGGAADALGAD